MEDSSHEQPDQEASKILTHYCSENPRSRDHGRQAAGSSVTR